MAGILSITNPATDSAAGYSTTTLPVTWTFTGTGTAVQVQRRVQMAPVGSPGTVILDTGMGSSTETTHTVGNLTSGVSYLVTVTVVDTNGGTTSATRTIVSSYSRPLPATLDFTDRGYALAIQVTNTHDGARPDATTNAVYRRLTGTTDDWTLVSTTGNSGTVLDYRARAVTSYDYFARTNGGIDSTVYTVTTGPILGVWAYVPFNLSTLANFPHAVAATESNDVESSIIQFVGRTYPVQEQGVARTDTLAVSVRLPPDVRQAGEKWWRDRKRNGDVFFYRDGRSRSWPVVIDGPVTAAPDGPGAVVTASIRRVDYQETMLPAASYGVVASSDGGYGTGGYGTIGYGI